MFFNPAQEVRKAIMDLSAQPEWHTVVDWLKHQHWKQSLDNNFQPDETALRIGQGVAQCLSDILKIFNTDVAEAARWVSEEGRAPAAAFWVSEEGRAPALQGNLIHGGNNMPETKDNVDDGIPPADVGTDSEERGQRPPAIRRREGAAEPAEPLIKDEPEPDANTPEADTTAEPDTPKE